MNFHGDIPVCVAMSRPLLPHKPDSYQICTQDRGHGGMFHQSCDGQGHVLARWLRRSVERYWTPALEATHDHGRRP